MQASKEGFEGFTDTFAVKDRLPRFDVMLAPAMALGSVRALLFQCWRFVSLPCVNVNRVAIPSLRPQTLKPKRGYHRLDAPPLRRAPVHAAHLLYAHTTFETASSCRHRGQLRFVLAWGAKPNDLDIHLQTPTCASGLAVRTATHSINGSALPEQRVASGGIGRDASARSAEARVDRTAWRVSQGVSVRRMFVCVWFSEGRSVPVPSTVRVCVHVFVSWFSRGWPALPFLSLACDSCIRGSARVCVVGGARLAPLCPVAQLAGWPARAACKISYQSKQCNDANQKVQLDYDVTSGYGPETITMLKPMDGTYRFYVHMYTADQLGWSQSQAVVKERFPCHAVTLAMLLAQQCVCAALCAAMRIFNSASRARRPSDCVVVWRRLHCLCRTEPTALRLCFTSE